MTVGAPEMAQQKRFQHQRQNHRAGNHAGVELVHLDVLFGCGRGFPFMPPFQRTRRAEA